MTGPEPDPEFEAFLKRRSPLYRRLSDVDGAEPPAELDRLVLKRARDAIETPERTPFYRTSRWAMPAGLAATILIAFTVLLNIDRQERTPEKQLSAAAAKAEAPNVAADMAAPAPEAREAYAPPASGAPVAPATAAAHDAHADADSWLRKIARLRAEGKAAEADRELEAFRQTYPSHSGASLATPPKE